MATVAHPIRRRNHRRSTRTRRGGRSGHCCGNTIPPATSWYSSNTRRWLPWSAPSAKPCRTRSFEIKPRKDRPMADVDLRPREVAAFWKKVQPSSDCWLWTANTSRGYGQFAVVRDSPKTVSMRAHRVAYRLMVGPIPEGIKLDHLCHNADADCRGGEGCRHRRCCNPRHLEPVTQRVNLLRGKGFPARQAAQTACIHGHQFDAENTYLQRRDNGFRRQLSDLPQSTISRVHSTIRSPSCLRRPLRMRQTI